MNSPSPADSALGIPYEEWTRSNRGIVSEQEQETLRNARVLLAGVGAEGSAVATCLARLGVTKFRLADLDAFDSGNLNRQFGCYRDTLGVPKVDALAADIARINPDAEIETEPAGVTAENAGRLVEGVSIISNGLDLFAVAGAIALSRAARAAELYMVAGVSLGFRSDIWVFGPGGMGLEEYGVLAFSGGRYPFIPDLPDSFPPDLWERVRAREVPVPAVAPTVFMTGARVATEMLCLLTGRKEPILVPRYTSYDVLNRTAEVREW